MMMVMMIVIVIVITITGGSEDFYWSYPMDSQRHFPMALSAACSDGVSLFSCIRQAGQAGPGGAGGSEPQVYDNYYTIS